MESAGRKLGSSRQVYILRFVLILLTIAVAAMAVIELAVALNLELTRTLVRGAMWVGTLFWLAVTAAAWMEKLEKSDNAPIGYMLFCTAIAAGSVAGICVPALATFARWANAGISAICLGAMVWLLLQSWNRCAAVQGDS